MTSKEQYNIVVESLRLVATSAEQQQAALPDFASLTDEVATTFGDAFLLVSQLEQAGFVSEVASAALRRLDAFLGCMPNENIADPESLKTHEFWARARVLASEALDALGEENRPPQLGWIAWLSGSGSKVGQASD
jgi:hypothetical protein